MDKIARGQRQTRNTTLGRSQVKEHLEQAGLASSQGKSLGEAQRGGNSEAGVNKTCVVELVQRVINLRRAPLPISEQRPPQIFALLFHLH